MGEAAGLQSGDREQVRRGVQKRTRWVVAAPKSEASAMLVRELGLPEAIARLLVSRGHSTVESAKVFLRPTLEHLHDPATMLGMAPAVERLRLALERYEPVLI